jgi:hypothetical protein
LVLLGGFALVAAGVATFWGRDAAERTPLNTNTYTRLTGTASGLLAKSDSPVAVKYLNHTQADPKASDGDVAALVETSCIVVDKDNPPECPGKASGSSEADPRVVQESVESFAVDRHTAMAAADQTKYIPDSDTAYQGLIDKLPFHAQKKTYPYWNGTLGKTVDLN